MISVEHSIIYCIVLKNPVNIYDIVPDVMKKHRCQVMYGTHGNPPGPTTIDEHCDYFCIVRDPVTDDRLVTSEYFDKHRYHWFEHKKYVENFEQGADPRYPFNFTGNGT
jgi:hypothetical protein